MSSESAADGLDADAEGRSAESRWHMGSLDDVCESLETTRDGLSADEAQRRLEEHGPNELPRGNPPTLFEILLRQFKSPLIYILLVAAAVALLVQDYEDAAFIGVVLLVNALIGGWQEWQAEQSSRALQELLQIHASVRRDGHTHEIPAQEVVTGDVVWVESGERLPADLRLIQAHGLEVDESLLTGESIAVTKDPEWGGDEHAPVGDRKNMAFAGSIVARGRGAGVVVATAADTMVGQLAVDVIGGGEAKPPLMQRMDQFSRTIAVVVLVAALGIGTLGVVVHEYGVLEMIMFGIALAVAAIPEGLPITITVALAIATTRMARRGVIVRRLAAVEGLGSCTLIASDKTGTLTVNELTVREIRLSNGQSVEVTGQGFIPEGDLLLDGQAVDPGEIPEDLRTLVRASVLCNEASLHRRDGDWRWRGDPTDVALLAMAQKVGVEREATLGELPQVNEIPFESEHQFAATYHRRGDGYLVCVKGAPERVLEMCGDGQDGTRDDRLQTAQQMADRGYRVLALAYGEVDEELAEKDTPGEPSGLTLAGFVGMIDPLREGVREAIADCRRAGVRVCMVTGDHPVTAAAIARDLEMTEGETRVVLGREIAEASPEELRELVGRSQVFARVAPRQKLEIVQAAQALGHFVAVTGDGVNDAPALRTANIGVAMGKAGTDVARESSELIISDDNFSTIVAGVEEGRIAYDNIRKVIFLLVSTGAAEVTLLGLAILSGVPLPLLPVQILWLNLVTSGIQDKPLAFEAAEDNVLRRPPREPQESVFNQLMIERTLVVALVMAALGYSSFVWMLKEGWSEEDARNGLLLFLVLMKTFHLGATRSETKYTFLMPPWKSPLLLACAVLAILVHLAAMYIPLFQGILGTSPVDAGSFLFFTLVATLVFVAMELHKWTWRLRNPDLT